MGTSKIDFESCAKGIAQFEESRPDGVRRSSAKIYDEAF